MKTIEISLDQYIGRKVKDVRKEKGIKQSQLAELLKISGMGLSHLENGNRSWKPSYLEILSKYFRKPIMYWLD